MSDLRGIVNQMITDRSRSAAYTGQHLQVPPPQPTLFAAKPTRAQGSRVQWLQVGVAPSLDSLDKGINSLQLVVTYARSLTDPRNGSQGFQTFAGGPSPNAHARDLPKTPNAYLNTRVSPPSPVLP